jgi:hypothetical protein
MLTHARVSLPPAAICAALRVYLFGAADFFGRPRPAEIRPPYARYGEK